MEPNAVASWPAWKAAVDWQSGGLSCQAADLVGSYPYVVSRKIGTRPVDGDLPARDKKLSRANDGSSSNVLTAGNPGHRAGGWGLEDLLPGAKGCDVPPVYHSNSGTQTVKLF